MTTKESRMPNGKKRNTRIALESADAGSMTSAELETIVELLSSWIVREIMIRRHPPHPRLSDKTFSGSPT